MAQLFAIKDAGDIYFKNIADNTPALFIDYANSASINIESSTIYAKAKGSNRVAWKGDTTGTLTISTEMVDSKLLAIMLGTDFVTTSSLNVSGKVTATVTGGKVTLVDTPVTGSVSVMALEGAREFYTVGGTVSATNVTVSGKDVTFDSSQNGKKVVVFYLKAAASNKGFKVNINNTSKAYYATMFTNVTLDTDNSSKFVALELFKVVPQQSASFTFDAANPSSFELTFDILANSTGDMLEYVEL